MCGELETPFFHRALARPDLSDPLGDTFFSLLARVQARWQPASAVQLNLGGDVMGSQ